jgi:hypothetical protein
MIVCGLIAVSLQQAFRLNYVSSRHDQLKGQVSDIVCLELPPAHEVW